MTKTNGLWLAAYLALMIAIVGGLLAMRGSVIAEMDTPEAHANWQAYREMTAQSNEAGPVQRRVPPSADPPTLVLLRDYFGVIVSAAVFFSSLLFVCTMLLVRGMLRGKPSGNSPANQ